MTFHKKFTSRFCPRKLTMTCDHNLTTSFCPSSTVNSQSFIKVGLTPEHHLFDIKQPNLVQQFQLAQDTFLIIQFLLMVKGYNSSKGLLSFFFTLDPGFEVYIGNIKVFDFEQHGINDEVKLY